MAILGLSSVQKPSCVVGIVGCGVVGKSYGENFKSRGYETICYSLDEQYRANKEKIKNADIVFICVPTPTTVKGADHAVVDEALSLVGDDKIAVIKSTVIPGTTRRLQEKFPSKIVLCSPELLRAATASQDAASPFLNVVGLPEKGHRHERAATLVHSILPAAPFSCTRQSEEVEIYKYAHNISGYIQVLAFNLVYDVAQHFDASWEQIRSVLEADPMVPRAYIDPIHKGGRGAGGSCFIKDFAAFAMLYDQTSSRSEGKEFLRAAQLMNMALLIETKKDVPLVEQVYGPLHGDEFLGQGGN